MIVERKKIGKRGMIFQFNDQNLVYLIEGQEKLFLCDTHMGNESMDEIKDYIAENKLENKELIIFNSHSDYDHVWGNYSFKNNTIIGHESCRKRMQEKETIRLELLKEQIEEDVEIKLPTLTFAEKLVFEDERIEFIYAPGHTVCSSICFDRSDSVLYAGDLLEYPIPVLLYDNLEVFLESLELLKSFDAETIICSHSGIVDEKLISSNIQYIRGVIEGLEPALTEDWAKDRHNYNRKSLLFLKYENILRKKLGDKFDYRKFKEGFWKLRNIGFKELNREYRHMVNIPYYDLEKTLKGYVDSQG